MIKSGSGQDKGQGRSFCGLAPAAGIGSVAKSVIKTFRACAHAWQVNIDTEIGMFCAEHGIRVSCQVNNQSFSVS